MHHIKLYTFEPSSKLGPVINKTAAVFLSLMVLMVVVLVVCFSAAVVVFLYMRTHRMQAGNSKYTSLILFCY